MKPNRSVVRRLRLFDIEHVQHQQHGQEWVPHWHDEWSFGAIVEGCCHCSVAGRPFVARAGDLLAIAPGTVHTGALLAADDDAVQVVLLYVPAAWLAHEGLALPMRSMRTPGHALAREAAALEKADDVRAWLKRAVQRLATVAPASQAVDPAPTAAARALLHCLHQSVLEGEATVAGLAGRCGVSRERVHRVVRATLGMAPGEYLRAVRVHRARQMLLAGSPIAEVADGCGFADQAHFTRWFRGVFAYSPGDLVRAHAAAGLQPPAPRWVSTPVPSRSTACLKSSA